MLSDMSWFRVVRPLLHHLTVCFHIFIGLVLAFIRLVNELDYIWVRYLINLLDEIEGFII